MLNIFIPDEEKTWRQRNCGSTKGFREYNGQKIHIRYSRHRERFNENGNKDDIRIIKWQLKFLGYMMAKESLANLTLAGYLRDGWRSRK